MADMRTSTVGRSGATERSNGNGNISDNVLVAVAPYNCGATGGGVERLWPFEAIHTPTVRSGSLLLFVTPQRCSQKSTPTFRQPLAAD